MAVASARARSQRNRSPSLSTLYGLIQAGGELKPTAVSNPTIEQGIEAGRVRPQPIRALTHVLMGASDEAALFVAESADPAQARADMLQVLDRLIDVVSA